MLRNLTAAVVFAAATMLAANGNAQQTPAASTQTAPAATTPKTPAKKPATATKSSAAAAPLSTKKDKFSYALGMNIGTGLGTNLKKQSVDVDWALVAQGLKDAGLESKTRMTTAEAQTVLTEMQNEVKKRAEEKTKELGEANKKEGDAFLAANKGKEGVVTLPSGLQYKIITQGAGPKPTPSDTVVCNYRGTLINGTEFDSSYKRGQPATFPVGGVIKGWTEALQLMPVGSKYQLFVPADLAYGERGAGADIGPNSTLIFEVELISIQKEQDKGKEEDKGKEPGKETTDKDKQPPKDKQ